MPSKSKNKEPSANSEDAYGNPQEAQLEDRQWKVRWPLNKPGLKKISTANTIITVNSVVPALTTAAGDVKDLVQTEDGPVPIAYLEPKPESSLMDEIDKDIARRFKYAAHLGKARWWAGRISPVEAGTILMNCDSLMGQFCVCQPPEWEPETGNLWPPFCLAVRSMSGDEQQMMYEWRETAYFNARFGEKFKERELTNDVLPNPPPGPPCPVIFFTIKRSAQGRFLLAPGNEFSSIECLLDYYHHHLLPTMGKKQLKMLLTVEAIANRNSARGPLPVIVNSKCPGHQHPSMPLILSTNTDMSKFYGRKWTNPFSEKDSSELVIRGYFFDKGKYNGVVIRKMRANLYNQEGFDMDMTLIHKLSGLQYKSLDPKSKPVDVGNVKINSVRGYNYISRIFAFGEDKLMDKWIAYEAVVGLPLDRLLQKRRYDDNFVSPRTKYEIMYQIAAGMRFLEGNLLCHRHLRGSNVIVQKEFPCHLTIKITDFMVPYHFLHKENVDFVDLNELDWPWWAPECIMYRCFDILTDIWAFGCVMFEIMHMGTTPYAYENPLLEGPMELLRFFNQGLKMQTVEPEELETFMDDVIQRCMSSEPETRPTFDHLLSFFRALLFDYTLSPDTVISEYIAQAPEQFVHKFKRGKLIDRKERKEAEMAAKKKQK